MAKTKVVKGPQRGLGVYSPTFGAGLIKAADGAWGEHGPVSWLQGGPAWIKGGMVDRRDWIELEFGGLLAKDVMGKLARLNVTVLAGSESEAYWRIGVPVKAEKRVRSILQQSNVSFIRRFTKSRK